MTMVEKIDACYSQELCGFITEHKNELTQECIERILKKAISMDMIFVVRRLRKYGLLRNAHMAIVREKCPWGYSMEIDQMRMQ